MAKLKFCTAGNVCITCSGLYDSLVEASEVIGKAQENGDKSFLCCNDGTGIRACIRVSDIAVITEVPSEPSSGDDTEKSEYR